MFTKNWAQRAHNETKIGPRTVPCGTPLHHLADIEHKSPMQTEKDLSFKYDLNHFKAVPLTPTSSKRCNKILWSTASNAAVRSSKIRITTFPESTAQKRSLKTLRRADSALWRDLKPDWNISITAFISKYDASWQFSTRKVVSI